MLEQLTRATFLHLSEPAGPGWLSIALPVGEAGGHAAATRLRQLRPALTAHLQAQGLAPAALAALLRPVEDLVEDLEHRANDHAPRVLLTSPGCTITCWVDGPIPEVVVFSPRPHLKPLLPLMTAPYYLLTLGKAGVQLFAGLGTTLERVALPGAPANLAALLQYDEFEAQHQLHPGVPGRGGERGPIFHGQGDAADQLKPQLRRYCQQIDRALRQALPEAREALILCGVSYLLDIYRAVSRYPTISAAAIVGSPERMTTAELASRAWAIVRPDAAAAQRAARERYDALAARGDARICTSIRLILPAAVAGQVETAFVALDQEQWGRYDPRGGSIVLHTTQLPGDEDLLNTVALQTIRHGGAAFVTPTGELPDGVTCAAVLRPGARGGVTTPPTTVAPGAA